MNKAGTKGRCGCAVVVQPSSPKPMGPSQSTRLVLDVGQFDAWEEHPAVETGPVSL